jgi:hypothetical protein
MSGMVAVSPFLHNNQCVRGISFTTNNPQTIFSKGNPMGKNKSRKMFQPGPHGGCEALLYEFREPPLQSGDKDDLPPASGQPHPRTVLIAAETVDEALVYLRFHAQLFNVHTIRCLGVILMISGSPAD